MAYKITVASWNANGVIKKQSHMINFLLTNKIDILIINETKLKLADKLKIKGYEVIRKDRDQNSGAGGVAILVKHSIPFQVIKERVTTTIEHTCIKLVNNTYIIAAYNKPSNKYNCNDISNLLKIGNKVLIIGDLNSKHRNWGCHQNNTNGNTLQNVINNSNAVILFPTTPTHYPANNTTPTVIDIVINKNVPGITDPVSLSELNSDHNPIKFQISNMVKCESKRIITSYKSTDWKKFRKDIDERLTIDNKIQSIEEIEAHVHRFTQILTEAKNQNSKQITVKDHKDQLPENILNLIKTKNSMRKNWQRTGNPQSKTLCKQLIHEINTKIKKHRNDKWTRKLQSLNPNDSSLWKMTKALKRVSQQIPTLTENGKTFITPDEKSNALAEAFEKVHKLDINFNVLSNQQIVNEVDTFLGRQHPVDNEYYTQNLVNPAEIKSIIRKLPNNKAPGPDKTENIILKNLSKKAIVQLTHIINAIIRLQHFPRHWKIAHVIPILKPNKSSANTTSYRPISLLCSAAKLTERIILNRIQKLDNQLQFTQPAQFGFRAKHNTVQQVARITNDVSISFNKKNITVMMLLDIQKAFDKVWTKGLIYKLIKLNFPANLIKLINSYLTDRQFQVKLNDTYSDVKNINSGVPQGSVLGPRLFTIFLHDLPEFQKTNTALFADDTAIYAHSHHAQVAGRQIQIHINMLEHYFTKWNITINPEKTEIIVFSKKHTNNRIITPVKVYNHNITPTHTVKYLGVKLDSKLNFKNHIKHALKKAYAVMKSIYPLMVKNNSLNQNNKKLLYTTIIRPIITYAAPVWCKVSKTALKPLQVYQNKCLRLILNADRYTRITELHEQTEIEYIQDHINRIAQTFYKTQLHTSPLTRDITKIRQHNIDPTYIHKLPYQTLPIFHEH